MMSFDKLLHFLCGYCITTTLFISPIAGMVVVVLAGASKEGYDYTTNKYLGIPHEVSSLDFIATVSGGVFGLGFVYVANYFFSHFPQLLGM